MNTLNIQIYLCHVFRCFLLVCMSVWLFACRSRITQKLSMNFQELFAGIHLEANIIDSIRLWDWRKLLFYLDYICKKISSIFNRFAGSFVRIVLCYYSSLSTRCITDTCSYWFGTPQFSPYSPHLFNPSIFPLHSPFHRPLAKLKFFRCFMRIADRRTWVLVHFGWDKSAINSGASTAEDVGCFFPLKTWGSWRNGDPCTCTPSSPGCYATDHISSLALLQVLLATASWGR